MLSHLEIYNGGRSKPPSVGGKLCGHNLPNPIITRSNEILIKFKSDNSMEESGYKLQAEAIGNYFVVINVISNCTFLQMIN